MTFPAYPDPKRYRRGTASAVLVTVCVTSLAMMSFNDKSEPQDVSVLEVAEAGHRGSVQVEDDLRLRAQQIPTREIETPDLIAGTMDMAETEESGHGQPNDTEIQPTQEAPPTGYDGDIDGDFDLAMITVVGTDEDFLTWIQSGIAMFEVSTRSGVFLSAPDGSLRRDVDLETDDRSGLRFSHEAGSALHARLGMALRDVGVPEEIEGIDVVFTHGGLSRIRALQDTALASIPSPGAFAANTISMTICSNGSGLGYGEIAETTTGRKIHVNGQGC